MTNRILIPSNGPDDWQQFLAKPDLQWATGYSARTLAYAWEAADGLPREIADLTSAAFGPGELLFAIPEHKTALPGGRRESQSDVFALVRHQSGLATYAIEGKVDEPFGPTVAEWLVDASAGKRERLDFILDLLGIQQCPDIIRYQLLHRTASALVEADRFGANLAGMIVHSFSPENRWRAEFDQFVELLGVSAAEGEALRFQVPSGKALLLGWASGDQRFRTA